MLRDSNWWILMGREIFFSVHFMVQLTIGILPHEVSTLASCDYSSTNKNVNLAVDDLTVEVAS